ncbi:MAG: Ger(x)C family spore germination C-terminal domain-containing protein [Hominilimicola sp.]
MRRFKAIIMTIIIVTFSFTLTGCAGKEPNEIAYIVALGIDGNENDNYEITIQYANPTQISGGASEEGGKSGSEIVENIVVEAPNIYAAVGLANHIVSKTFSLSHAKIIVFSQEVAKKGLKDITETFIRSEELRPDVYLAVAENANEYLTSVKPVMEVNPAKYYQLIYDKNNLMGIPEGVAKNFFFGIETKDYDSLLPAAGVISGGQSGASEGGGSQSGSSEGRGSNGGEGGSESEKPQKNSKQQEAPLNEGGFEYKMKSYTGGQAAIEFKNKSEAMGSVIFDGDKMVGTIGSIETEIFKMLVGDYKYSYITLYNDKTPEEPVTVKSIQEKRPKYNIDIDNKKINVELFIEGDVYSLPSDYNIESDIENFEKNSGEYIEKACEEFMSGFLKSYNCDIFRLNEKCKKKFLTNKKYNEFKDNVGYSDFDVDVKANFKIRRTGLVVRED